METNEKKQEVKFKENPALFIEILEAFDYSPGEVAPPLNYFWEPDNDTPIVVKDYYTIKTVCSLIDRARFTAGKNYGRALLQQEFRNLFNLL